MEKPKLLIVAGPNGSGKTSVTNKILKHDWIEGCEYINPDNIARDVFGDWNSPDAVMKGGHDVPISKIVSRYYKSIANCGLLVPVVDRLYVYDNSVDDVFPQLLFRASNGKLTKQYAPMRDWANIIFHIIN